MICPTCKKAGEANSSGDESRAAVLHARCPGLCTCQHKTGSGHLNLPLIEENRDA